jgi:hypothetical protein
MAATSEEVCDLAMGEGWCTSKAVSTPASTTCGRQSSTLAVSSSGTPRWKATFVPEDRSVALSKQTTGTAPDAWKRARRPGAWS